MKIFVCDVRVIVNILYMEKHEPAAQSEFNRWFATDTSVGKDGNFEVKLSRVRREK